MDSAFVRDIPKTVDEVLAYQHERLVGRYEIDFGVDRSEALRRFNGLKQFLVLCALTPGYKVTSDRIDSMWHTFLLFTKDYREFCLTYLGRFINHEPFERPSPDDYLVTRARAQELFGSIDEELWPAEAKGDCSSGCQD